MKLAESCAIEQHIERLLKGRGSQGRMPTACSDLCGAMGALRHKVLASGQHN